MKKRSILLLALCSMMVLSGCKDKEDEAAAPAPAENEPAEEQSTENQPAGEQSAQGDSEVTDKKE